MALRTQDRAGWGWGYLRDVKLCKVLIAAIRVLSTGPVTVYQVMLLPEERRGGVEVCEVLVL